MNMINTRAELVERLKGTLAVETLAKQGYDADLLSFINVEIITMLTEISADETKHINILNQLIRLIE